MKRKKRKSDFARLCDEIEEKESKEINYIQLAREKVQEHIKGDNDKRLQLLAEAEEEEFNSHLSTMISMFSLATSVLTLILSTVNDFTKLSPDANPALYIIVGTGILKIVILVGIILLGCRLSYFMKKYKNASKWRKYVLIVLHQEMQ